MEGKEEYYETEKRAGDEIRSGPSSDLVLIVASHKKFRVRRPFHSRIDHYFLGRKRDARTAHPSTAHSTAYSINRVEFELGENL